MTSRSRSRPSPASIAEAPARIGAIAEFRLNCFGHMGDGNLALQRFPDAGEIPRRSREPARRDQKRAVHDLVMDLGGSVSAEHGVGRLKVTISSDTAIRESWQR